MVLTHPHPVLRRPGRPVTPGSHEAREVASSLRAAFGRIEALGLAANQIGFPLQAILVRLSEGERVLFNPEIAARSAELVVESEGCLSLPGVEAEVPRAKDVIVHAVDEQGTPVELRLSGLEARVVQHEVDHINGTLYVDLLPKDERRRVLAEVRLARAQAPKEQVPSLG